MTVTLTPEQEKFIAERLHRGDYSTPAKVLDEGLKLIEAKEEYQRQSAELKREIQIGLDQTERGEVVDGKETIERLLKINAARARK